jgi:ferredoxin
VAVTVRIVVNPITCVGHGICAELFPERITLDDWGYPIIDPRPIPETLEDHARRAVAACPTLALLLRPADEPVPRREVGRRG